MTTYRDFAKPAFASQEHSVVDWMTWLEQQNVLIPTAPRPEESCETCGGAVGRRDGGFWTTCYQCGGYESILDAFVPITYSTSTGLESMLHRFKDWQGYDWMRLPLGSLLHVFLTKHRTCLGAQVFGVDVATFVPSNTPLRSFIPLQRIRDAVSGNNIQKWFSWDTSIIAREFTKTRPERAEVKPEAYTVSAPAVTGKAVLLLDDTWTSGSSLMSSAAALKKAGARAVIGLALGRQLNTDGHYGSTDEILADVRGREWTDDDCVLCAT